MIMIYGYFTLYTQYIVECVYTCNYAYNYVCISYRILSIVYYI